MQRNALKTLSNWLVQPSRKPLVLRGARQVGKTYLVRQLAKMHQLTLIELNFEKNPEHASLFASNDVKKILALLEAHRNTSIDPSRTLLFLDEIQTTPELLAKLRWFAEDLPELAVIATGSLLDFVLDTHSFSMPVGRIGYYYLEPLSFEEFLVAIGRDKLADFLATYHIHDSIAPVLHFELLELLRDYFLVGGMPAAVNAWVESHHLLNVSQIQQDLLSTYRDDFNKYPSRIDKERLEEVVASIPHQLGKKFIFKHVNQDVQGVQIKKALHLLSSARLCHFVFNNHVQGIPLAAGKESKYFKMILLDIGLCNALLKLNITDMQSHARLMNEGGLAEQFIAQMLRTLNPYFVDPELYYWSREEKTSTAEVDYIIQQGSQLIPIEVKAGKTGTLKSLHVLMGMRQWPLAVRFNIDFPSITPVDVKTPLQQTAHYQLLSLPLYLVGQLPRLINETP